MNPYAIPPLIVTVLVFLLGLFVYTRDRQSKLNVTFSLFCLSMTVWLIGFTVMYASPNKVSALWWARTGFVGVTFVPATMYHFVASFLGLKQKRLITMIYLSSFLGLTICFTDLVYAGIWTGFWGYYPIAGPLYPLFPLVFSCCFVGGVVQLSLALRRELQPLRRQQIKYVMFAFACGTPGVIDYVVKYQIHIYPFGYLTALVLISLIAYAIVRHKLLDIQVIIKRTLVFAGLVGAVVVVVSMVAFVSQDLLARVVAIPKWLSNVLAAAIIAATYGRLRNWLVEVTDKYLFQKKYDYKELLRKFSDEVAVGIRDLKQLVEMTVERLTETVKLGGCSLLLLNRDTHKYELAASKGSNGQQVVLEEQEAFIAFLRQTREPIGLDGQLGKVRFPEEVGNRLKQLNARLCLPLIVHEDLIGVLCLGKKKSDEEFTADDVGILMTLVSTLAIAVSNAQLFDELSKTQAEAAQKEKLAVIGTLSAGINHEICNPLGIVKAQCEAFVLDQQDGLLVGKSAKELQDRVASIIQVTLKQIDRATAITQKLSSFAKPIKATTVEQVSVANEVDEVVLLVGHDLELQKITIEREVAADLPPIMVDRRQFQEVLFNLIRNAGQAIAPPGTISVRAKEVEGRVRIEIADTGSGIPADKLDKIYDPFFTTKEPGKGTGLGLFIVRQIIERNKGRISVQSTVGQGTTFFLDFPAAIPERAIVSPSR